MVTEEVLITRNMISGLEATPGRGFRVSSSFMARSPSGVAALSRPSMLAAMFMVMLPMAGWPAGTSGMITRNSGVRRAAIFAVRPAASIMREMPSQKHIIPASPMTMSVADPAAFRNSCRRSPRAFPEALPKKAAVSPPIIPKIIMPAQM